MLWHSPVVKLIGPFDNPSKRCQVESVHREYLDDHSRLEVLKNSGKRPKYTLALNFATEAMKIQ